MSARDVHEQAAAILAALAAAGFKVLAREPTGEWQPIETAPLHDDCLVWNGKRVAAAWRSSTGSWHEVNTDSMVEGYLEPHPTHWMRYPEPPQVRKA